jgi:hypothetical protein
MARTVKRLTDRAIKRELAKGLYADGDGLCLQVSAGGSKSWIFRFKRNGRARDMGLGGLSAVSLRTARKMAKKVREDLAEGRDPSRLGISAPARRLQKQVRQLSSIALSS